MAGALVGVVPVDPCAQRLLLAGQMLSPLLSWEAVCVCVCLVAWGGVWPWFLVEGAWLWGRPTGRDEIVPTSFAERKGSGLALPRHGGGEGVGSCPHQT